VSENADLLRIGEFARRGQTNLRTLRYYEELGLMRPATRTNGGIRYYRDGDLNRLRRICELQELGLSLEKIRDLLSTRSELGESCGREHFISRVRAALEQQEMLLTQRIEGLERQRELVREAMAKASECTHCFLTPSAENNFCDPCRITGEPLPPHLSALF
jgi:DNA-binding transcriptional MerR regulator